MTPLQQQVYAHALARNAGLDGENCRLAARVEMATEAQLHAALKVGTPHEIKSALSDEAR